MSAAIDDVQRRTAGREIDTVRALLHDLRQPLAAILLMAGAEGGDDRRKLDVIAGQAQWLSEVVETSLSEAATDEVVPTDVERIVREGVDRAAATTGCRFTVDVVGARRAWARPVALSRALACVLDNAVRAAGESGAVTVTVVEDSTGTHVRVADTGPGFGRIASRTSLGLTTTRAMVAACQGTFDIRDGRDGGAVADICLGTVGLEAVAS